MSYTVTKMPRSLVFYWTSGSFGTVTMSYKTGYKLMIFYLVNRKGIISQFSKYVMIF